MQKRKRKPGVGRTRSNPRSSPGARRLPRKVESSKARRAPGALAAFESKYGFRPQVRGGVVNLTPRQLRTMAGIDRAEKRARDQAKAARAARDAYRPRKSDHGKVILIGKGGGKNPQSKGRKGYAAYVTKTGKVWLLNTGTKDAYKPRKARDIQLPVRRNIHKAVDTFKRKQLSHRKVTRDRDEIKAAVNRANRKGLKGDTAALAIDFDLKGSGKGRGQVKGSKGHDFNRKMVDKLASDFRKVIKSQQGQRSFQIEVIALVRLSDGSKDVVEFTVPIARNDHDAIRIGGIKNFVEKMFYKHLAGQLSFRGWISSGSANHIRQLANAGTEVDEDRLAQIEQGELTIVTIEQIEWRMVQS